MELFPISAVCLNSGIKRSMHTEWWHIIENHFIGHFREKIDLFDGSPIAIYMREKLYLLISSVLKGQSYVAGGEGTLLT